MSTRPDPDDNADPPHLDLPPAQEARNDAARERAWIVASLAASQDLTDAEIADRVGCSRARVGQIRAEQGIAGRGAGRPRGEAVTHRSQAGRLLLAALVDQAAQLGVTPDEIVAAGVEAIGRRRCVPADRGASDLDEGRVIARGCEIGARVV